MKRRLALIAITMSVLPASVATAHPGHGYDAGDYNLIHYLTEPVHLVAGLGTLVVFLLAITLLRRVALPMSKSLG